MTEKRFTDIEVGADTGRVRLFNGLDFYEYSPSELLQLLNHLHEENSLLKDIIKDIVIKLEANYTSHTYEMTIPINRVIYNELRRRLKETSFNEELRRFLDD